MTTKSLEEQFLEETAEAYRKLEKELEKIRKALDRAVQIAEKSGIPFTVQVGYINQWYVPKSFPDNPGNKDPEVLSLISQYIGMEPDYLPDTGWTSSSDQC